MCSSDLLVSFVSDELTRFFARQFLSQRPAKHSDADQSDDAFIAMMAGEFMEFLETLKDSDDKWISACANFIKMANDFDEFVKAYRIGDAISIEYGYHKHLPVWECNGQKKYVEITYKQDETLYQDSPYSMLQEIRIKQRNGG